MHDYLIIFFFPKIYYILDWDVLAFIKTKDDNKTEKPRDKLGSLGLEFIMGY